MAHDIYVALHVEVDDDRLDYDVAHEFVDHILRQALVSPTASFRLVRIDSHTDGSVLFPTEDDDCSDHGAGYLIGQTYGQTEPPAGGVLIQACGTCQRFEGDIDAALEYANRHGGRVHAIGDGETMVAQTDTWVMPDEPWNLHFVQWHTEAEAIAEDWIEPKEDDA